MKRFAPLLLPLLLGACREVEHVTPAKFKAHYATVGLAGTMQTTDYLGQRDGRAFIRVNSMSPISRKWSDRVIYAELAELESAFRDSLPKMEMRDAP